MKDEFRKRIAAAQGYFSTHGAAISFSAEVEHVLDCFLEMYEALKKVRDAGINDPVINDAIANAEHLDGF